MKKKTGILLPLFSLPGKYGIGDFGKVAFDYIDMLKDTGIDLWQILPLNPVGFGYSPYQPFSSFAGDEIYIDLDDFVNRGWIQEAIDPFNEHSNRVSYHDVHEYKKKWLRKAYEVFRKLDGFKTSEYLDFAAEAHWLDDYSLFMVFKQRNGLKSWVDWPEQYRDWSAEDALSSADDYEVGYTKFTQFVFFQQWYAIRDYANQKQIEIMGDIPFYVGLDSADVWANRSLFLLRENQPIFIAGVPPDYFSETGQRWGNPIYDWEMLKKLDYKFWIDRLSWNNRLFDIVRLDHFRAFDTYWKINSASPTAVEGVWELGPSFDFFDHLFRVIPDLNVIAEDLGDLRPEVRELKDYYKLMGMKIIQFSLDANENNNNFGDSENLIVYTGTHDNQTIEGWYQLIDEDNQRYVKQVLNENGITGESISEKLVNYALSSIANVVVIPLQDVLGLKDDARINVPSTIGSPNWEWKLTGFQETRAGLSRFKQQIKHYRSK